MPAVVGVTCACATEPESHAAKVASANEPLAPCNIFRLDSFTLSSVGSVRSTASLIRGLSSLTGVPSLLFLLDGLLVAKQANFSSNSSVHLNHAARGDFDTAADLFEIPVRRCDSGKLVF